jgi:hypothetical protein
MAKAIPRRQPELLRRPMIGDSGGKVSDLPTKKLTTEVAASLNDVINPKENLVTYVNLAVPIAERKGLSYAVREVRPDSVPPIDTIEPHCDPAVHIPPFVANLRIGIVTETLLLLPSAAPCLLPNEGA